MKRARERAADHEPDSLVFAIYYGDERAIDEIIAMPSVAGLTIMGTVLMIDK